MYCGQRTVRVLLLPRASSVCCEHRWHRLCLQLTSRTEQIIDYIRRVAGCRYTRRCSCRTLAVLLSGQMCMLLEIQAYFVPESAFVLNRVSFHLRTNKFELIKFLEFSYFDAFELAVFKVLSQLSHWCFITCFISWTDWALFLAWIKSLSAT